MSRSGGIAAAERLLSEIVIKYATSPLVACDMEKDLQQFLQLVQQSHAERESFVVMFNEMISGQRRSPDWLVAYCMRVLRWPEVHAAAEAAIRKGVPSTLSDARDVLTAYGDEWTGSDLFTHVK
jgi:hypothetical protein